MEDVIFSQERLSSGESGRPQTCWESTHHTQSVVEWLQHLGSKTSKQKPRRLLGFQATEQT